MMRRTLGLSLLFATTASLAGCAGTATYSVSGPDLVYIEPGVQVIADYDEPIFFANDYYWRQDGGVWYRSNRWNGGWAYASPPQAIIHIDSPGRYRNYRPAGYTPRRQVVDHRTSAPPPRRAQPQPQPQPPRQAPRNDTRSDDHPEAKPANRPRPPAPEPAAPVIREHH